jgi:hypothetical protein
MTKVSELEIEWDEPTGERQFETISGRPICAECDGDVLYNHDALKYICDDCGERYETG